MNLQQLYYFRMIAQLEHFTKAAEKLMVSQSSLSHSINDLEQELGIHLFERQGRNVKLTKYGRIFLEYVEQALDILEEGQHKLDEFMHPDRGVISLCYFSFLEEFILYLVSRFLAETSRLAYKLQLYQEPTANSERKLLEGDVDLAIGAKHTSDKLASHKIGEHNMVLIVPDDHPLAGQRSVDLSKLGSAPFITYNYQCQIRGDIDISFDMVGIRPTIVSEAAHDTVIYSSVAAGFGVALVPEPLGAPHYRVKTLRVENDLPKREIFLSWKTVRYMSPAVKRFRDYIVKCGLVLDEYRAQIHDAK